MCLCFAKKCIGKIDSDIHSIDYSNSFIGICDRKLISVNSAALYLPPHIHLKVRGTQEDPNVFKGHLSSSGARKKGAKHPEFLIT